MGRTLSGWDYLSGREGQTGDFQKMKFEIDCIETKIIYIEIYRYIYIYLDIDMVFKQSSHKMTMIRET
jgi:uncharacterized membrane protein YhdT